jgi:hypothetical protein
MRKLCIAKYDPMALPGDLADGLDFPPCPDRIPSQRSRSDAPCFRQHGIGQAARDCNRRPAEKQIRKMRHCFVHT